MKAAIITAFLALCISFVAAQSTPFYITHPLQGDSFKAGSTVTIEWKNGVDKAAKVALLTGTSDATMKYTGVAFTIDGSKGEYDWKVPSDLPQNATFSLKIDFVDPTTKAAGTSYSAPFSLAGTTGDVVTQSFVSASVTPSAPVSSKSVVASSSPIPKPSSSPVPKPTSSPVASPSTSPVAEGSASGFKVATTTVCVMALIASALVF
ncbi:hypothetical protein BDF21DRAFT_429920 [Thamnidium elegans]|uniref:Yeast cell wall synthesis Kre9/Knh1-like N-terminal domain-containing protein n=1 Tax=Thamnidium elegans TaxID=101142 RepID=A0A8H7W1R5_9FUNG|nr:hypothetical protein INT48_006952 [Thamnidium elegans]KAI8058742.1 hypothetical protein BDF21DRAFT_429920 [Thamnidium elegans]